MNTIISHIIVFIAGVLLGGLVVIMCTVCGNSSQYEEAYTLGFEDGVKQGKSERVNTKEK